MSFTARFDYGHDLVRDLGRIEAARAVIDLLPLPPDASLRLRHDALQRSTRSSTQIEGNPLTEMEVLRAVGAGPRSPSEAEQEVRNYWRALDRVDELSVAETPITEDLVRELHRTVIVLGQGRRGTRSEYRKVACPVVDTATRRLDYAPPRPEDVPSLMADLLRWLGSEAAARIPAVLRAGLLTHRFLSIHPFGDGNGRTGRLLATAELWRSGYRMRGFLSFEEHFSADRLKYYDSLQMRLPVDFYSGRHDPDHSPWLGYFTETIARAADALRDRASALHRETRPESPLWDRLSRREQQVLTRLHARRVGGEAPADEVRSGDIAEWFGVSLNTAREWLGEWAESGFLDAQAGEGGQRVRRYRLGQVWRGFIEQARGGAGGQGTPGAWLGITQPQ